VGSESGDEDASRSELPDWAWEQKQIERVAARFPGLDTDELKAELALTLLEIKRRPPSGIRNWKAYLAACLSHRALTLARKWRARARWEVSMPFDYEMAPRASRPTEKNSSEQRSRRLLIKARRLLDGELYQLLKLLAAPHASQSSVARHLGVHRNTIGRRLQRIRRLLLSRPNKNVTSRLHLSVQQRQQLTSMAQASGANIRDRLKARLILSLASGWSYTQIEEQLNTTRPTISRWKHRFQEHGINGLRTQHQGRKPRLDARERVADWLQAAYRQRQPAASLTCRRIANALRLSKSTVHRILRQRGHQRL
jgi:transposase